MTTIDDIRAWFSDLALASKCLLLFGAASALIITIALSLPLLRMNGLVGSGERSLARSVYATWMLEEHEMDGVPIEAGGAVITPMTIEQANAARDENPFIDRSLDRFERSENRIEYFDSDWVGWSRLYRFAHIIRDETGSAESIVLIEHRSAGAGWLMVINLLYVVAAGVVVLAVALVVFAWITEKLILKPVLSLQKTAEKVRDGNLDIRSTIATGDEFEELAETINLMLTELQRQQDQLRGANAAMDIKLAELSQANVALFESARLKGEFLASVSHELRTPLNAIIGFAELLLEIVRREVADSAEQGDNGSGLDPEEVSKRERYLVNIVSAGRTLLEMIESLLEMAKIEAGRVELNIGPMNISDTCQALVGLIHPLARKKDIKVLLDLAEDIPIVETDAKKFQQIVFNLLSNAVKFTGESATGKPGEITLRAERLPDDDSETDRLRVSVIDNGQGIAPDDQKKIFDKFQQVDSSHTRAHAGTGLGLAIVSELTRLLQGEIQLVSEIGSGSMFSVILPTKLDETILEETKLEAKFRGALRPPAINGTQVDAFDDDSGDGESVEDTEVQTADS
ncbi:MAG: HAMP domain-containing histidine kinase [Phycisphaerales bacterium]|nr:HAMP domain-containing histidine kinase [Phycisphaerales bacterium]